MEVGVATAPVGDLGEGVSDENILVGTQDSNSTHESLSFYKGLWGPFTSSRPKDVC